MYPYILEPYRGMKTRNTCPACGKAKKFTRYINTQTGEHLPPEYGRCERVNSCGYWRNPPAEVYGKTPGTFREEKWRCRARNKVLRPLIKPLPPSIIPDKAFFGSRNSYEQNCFVKYLLTLFDATTVTGLIGQYHIGTSKHWPCATVFWQISKKGDVRTGKIMLYNPLTGRRVKEPYDHITWAHKVLGLEGYQLGQCFFGEHLLLLYPEKRVAVVESEKTAIIASAYYPQYVWLATGGISNISAARCEALRDRKVEFFPDLGAYQKWFDKAAELSDIAYITVSDILERIYSGEELKKGFDIADYLIQYRLQEFQGEPQTVTLIPFSREGKQWQVTINRHGYPASWGE